MRVKFRNALLAVAATMVSLTAGCSDGNTPVSPRAEPPAAAIAPGELRASASAIAQLARFRQKPQLVSGWAKAWIGPAGGRVDFVGFTLIVPPGAVSRVTMFSIKLPLDPDGSEHVVAEFGPHNTTFARPLIIGFPFRGTSVESDPAASVVWWNGSNWQNMGGAISANGSQIFTQTPHFSEYGTAAYRGGGITASGG